MKYPYSVQYKRETGNEPFGFYDDNGNIDHVPHDTSGLPNFGYVNWLIKKVDLGYQYKCRCEAAEKEIELIRKWDTYILSDEDIQKAHSNLQNIVKEMG